MTPPQLLTDRLVLRPVEPGDVELLIRLSASDGAAAADIRRIEAFIRESANWWHSHGFGAWIATWKHDGEPAGWCSLRPSNEPRAPELSYGVRADIRGRGVATEAARAVITQGFGVAQVKSIWAAATPAHAASIRVMQKLGMAFQFRTLLDGVDSVIYRIERCE